MLYIGLRLKADHSSRGFLPIVVCPLSVIAKPRKGDRDPESGCSATGKKSMPEFAASNDEQGFGENVKGGGRGLL